MLQTLIQIGKKLREDKNDVAFLPFVEIGNLKEKIKNEKIIQERPVVQFFDIYINKDRNWEIKKAEQITNENHPPIFIKGDNNDRFYIAGDINGNYFGANVSLEKYFYSLNEEIERAKELIPDFIYEFRRILQSQILEIEKLIREFNVMPDNKKSVRRLFIQFRFNENGQIRYWHQLIDEIEKVGEFILNTNYIKKKNGILLLKKIPVSFYSEYNLNNLQNLNQENSNKIINIQESEDSVKNMIIGSRYTNNKISYFGKALIQVLPSGEYSREVLMRYLDTPLLNQRSGDLKDIQGIDLPLLNIFTKSNAGINKFDILFLNKGAQTIDVINNISSVELSDIEKIQSKWKTAKLEVKNYYENNIKFCINSDKIKEILENEIDRLNPFGASNNLLKGFGKSDDKLIKYHRQVLYKIFRDQYFHDSLILNGLISKTEYGLRSSSSSSDFKLFFKILFLNYYFLDNILLYPKFLIMQESKSYQAGKLLGLLARNIDQEINSFSKQYAGNISRRISTLEDMQKLLNFIQEKLVIHEKLYTSVRITTTELNELIANFGEMYKRENAVAGFFYSYMMPFKNNKEQEELQN